MHERFAGGGVRLRRVPELAGSTFATFIRGWHWEQTSFDQFATDRCPVRPLPYARTGPGTAIDRLPKSDSTRLNQEYFDRILDRVGVAGRRGILIVRRQ